MPKRPSVVVGMSGGVDSAVAAALLCQAGYQVIGVTLVLWEGEAREKRWQDRSCCKVGLARHVAKLLAIPHHTFDIQESFQREVIDDFCDTYLLGQTPNPCVRCNERIKFSKLLAAADEWGGDFLATGHYAQIEKDKGFTLKKGSDPAKDQSYFLYRLNQAVLGRTLFPLGAMKKEEVYQKASQLGLPYEEVLESQEICFVNQQDYRTVLAQYRPEALSPGPIVTESGEPVGSHAGIAFHTVGQRRGLGVALGERVYVTRVNPAKNEVVVGPKSALLQKGLMAHHVVWGEGKPLAVSARVSSKIRYRSREQEGTVIEADEDSFRLLFDTPVEGVSPGQSVVLYQGDRVVGGGIIKPEEEG